MDAVMMAASGLDWDDSRVVRAKAKPHVEVVVERPARAINHMDPDTKMVHVRLEAWAPWAKDRGIRGYPRQSLTEKAAQYGKLGIPQESNYKGEPEMPEPIAITDAAVARLCQIDQKVVKIYYLHWEPTECMARRAGMRVRQFQNVLRRARWRLAIHIAQLEHAII